MTRFNRNIQPFVKSELEAAAAAEAIGDSQLAFSHLERAHVLGQASTLQHVHVHWQMLHWGARRQSIRECLGQVFRIIGAATKTVFGLIPHGNTGGANVSPFKPMAIPPELQIIIQDAGASRRR